MEALSGSSASASDRNCGSSGGACRPPTSVVQCTCAQWQAYAYACRSEHTVCAHRVAYAVRQGPCSIASSSSAGGRHRQVGVRRQSPCMSVR